MTWTLFAHNLPYLLVGAFPQGPLGGAALTLVLALCSALASAVLGIAGGIALALAGRIARVPLLLVIGFFRAIPVLMLIFGRISCCRWSSMSMCPDSQRSSARSR
jgi:ABC-type amino acid transport system, permease component